MKSSGLPYVANQLPDTVEPVANEIGLIAIGLLLAFAIWRSFVLTYRTSANERMRMRAAAWSILRDAEEPGLRWQNKERESAPEDDLS